jgi:predicted SprT family Zn-dependent metalloprotease
MKQDCNCGSRFCTKPKVEKKKITDGYECPNCGEDIDIAHVDSRARIFYTIDLCTLGVSSEETGDEDTSCATYYCPNCDEEITGFIEGIL